MSKGRKPKRSREGPQPSIQQPIAQTPWDHFLRPHGWRLLALFTLVFLAYSNSFQAGLIFDNHVVIARDTRVQAVTTENIREILTGGYWQAVPAAGLYRPLTTFSYMLNYAVLGNGPRPEGYHWLNLALHCANIALIYALGILVLDEAILALALAAIWGLHPLLTESITNVVGRADLLAAFGVLAGLLCYVKSLATTGRTRLAWLAATATAQTVGLFSKESAAVLPGIMLLYDLTWSDRATWRRRLPAYAALAAPFALYFYMRAGLPHMLVGFNENPMAGADFWTGRLTAIKVIGELLWLFFWPAHLSADYSYNAVPLFGWRLSQWEDLKAIVAAGACLFAVLLALSVRRKSKPAFFFILFFFITLAPTSNLLILIGSVMAERFMYLPAIGVAGCVVVAIQGIVSRLSLRWPAARRVEWTAMSLICLSFAARTYARNFDWRDELSLWTSTVSVCPDSDTAHLNLGHALAPTPSRLADAVAEYKTALRIRPGYAQAHYDMGVALARMPDRLPEAIAEFREAVRISPDFAEAHYNLGTALSRLGRTDEAVAEWQATLRIQPGHPGAHTNLGNTFSKMPNRMPNAIAEWKAAIRGDPAIAEPHYNLGNALSDMPGHLPEAIAEYQAAIACDPTFAEAHNNLANALARLPGRMSQAIGEWQTALRLEPNLFQAHYNLGSALSQIPGRMSEAITEYESALRIQPSPELQQTIEKLRASQ